jgi:hypothetical protein
MEEDKIKGRENILNIKIPLTLYLLYMYFGNYGEILTLKEETKLINYRLLNIDEIKVEKEITVYDPYKGEPLFMTDILVYGVNLKNKNFYGVDLNKNWDLICLKNKWCWIKDNMPLHKNLLILLICLAIANKKYICKTNIKNAGSFDTIENVDEIFSKDFKRFRDFEHYGHTAYYNSKNSALGWMRAGNNCPEILIGCDNKKFLDELIKKYEFDKIKFINN